jgi:prepilin-type N-terminal cleavage/methylation domain-containing protein
VSARADLAGERGMTLIEVMVAMAIGITLVLGISTTLDHGVLNSLGHQRQASALSIAQREVEKVRQTVAQYGFDAIALSSLPGAPTAGALATNPTNPDDFQTGYGTAAVAFRIMESFHNTALGVASTTPANGEPLVVGGTAAYPTTGRVDPKTTGVTSGNVTATVYRYVTRRTEACLAAGACDGDSRRVTIVVVPTNDPGTKLQTKGPVYFSTVVDSPVPKSTAGQAGAGLRIGVNIT